MSGIDGGRALLPGESPVEFVAGRIVGRYDTPARKAYTYLFRLAPGGDLGALIPDAGQVIASWVDEGTGLIPTPIDVALAKCRAAAHTRPHQTAAPGAMSAHQRKQMMARSILYSVEQTTPEQVGVNLVSRALGFSPKGDRQAREVWKCAAESGIWYSTRREEADREEA